MSETLKTASDAKTNPGAMTRSHYPAAPERFEMGDQRRFHWRILNDRHEVYSIGLEQWAECSTAEKAKTVADALEAFYRNAQRPTALRLSSLRIARTVGSMRCMGSLLAVISGAVMLMPAAALLSLWRRDTVAFRDLYNHVRREWKQATTKESHE